ncbi:hypothetical protein F2P44_25020 [Massilia sp. CCM 8695]|uniref:Periplasmic heavy metal sensor n=1 Tax=Massilia frigida TaxID=2609281 RepID=A0ABX0NAQ8_9BURK|nr:hypothetical protein [Massilia frigida]NHZ82516.1 hypothetical protein [Massilia frigida]
MFRVRKSALAPLCLALAALAPSAGAQCQNQAQAIKNTARAIGDMGAAAPAQAEKLAKVKAIFDELARKMGWDETRTLEFQRGLAQNEDYRAVELQRKRLEPAREALRTRLYALEGTPKHIEACKVSAELAAVTAELGRLDDVLFDYLLAGAAAVQ